MNPIQYLAHELMIPILNFFHGVTQSYGWAIVLLTLSVKAGMFPLTAKQFKASRSMQKLQPKMAELQAKYKDKPEELQAKMMEFYKENNANPFSSCLPTLIQLPFLFALYAALIDKGFQAQIAHKSFYFIQNLAAVGVMPSQTPGHVHGILWDNLAMVIFFGISTYLMQKMMTTNPSDPMQAQMLTMMPIMMTVMFVFFPLPSGILLYIMVSNIISLVQNFVLTRQLAAAEGLPAGPASQAVIDATPQVVKDEVKPSQALPPSDTKKRK